MALIWPTTGAAVATSMKWPENRAAELEDYALVAVSKIEEKVGPWHDQELTFSVTLRKASTRLVLPWPIASLQTITRDGAPVNHTDADVTAGVVYGDFNPGTYTVTATARSAASCPPDIALAARKLAAHLAKQELVGPPQPGFAGGVERDIDVQQGFALPRAVSELIADYVLPGAFA